MAASSAAVQARIIVADAMAKLSTALNEQAQAIAGGATPSEVVQSIQVAVGNISQQLAQSLP